MVPVLIPLLTFSFNSPEKERAFYGKRFYLINLRSITWRCICSRNFQTVFEHLVKIRLITDKVTSWIDLHEVLFPGDKKANIFVKNMCTKDFSLKDSCEAHLHKSSCSCKSQVMIKTNSYHRIFRT